MKNILAISLTILSIFMSGCSGENHAETHTVNYYTENIEEMKKKIKECQISMAEQLTFNCANAKKAQAIEELRLLKNEGISRNK